MSTRFKPIIIPPGVVSTPTKKVQSSNWSEVNLVRWTEGKLAPIGGQLNFGYTFASRCKRVHGWYGLDKIYRIAYLCEHHLYVVEGGTLHNISPTSPPLASPVTTRVGGYGDGLYGAGTYGTARPTTADTSIDKIPAAYSLDNFGAILLAMTSADGRLLKWDPASGTSTHATLVAPASGSTVPAGRGFVVTPERFVMIYGSYNDGTAGTGLGGSERRFAWSEQEDFTTWKYDAVVGQAGFLDIEPASPIITALSTKTGVLLWTSQKIYRSRFLGLPFVYNCEELGDDCCPWSPQSMTTTSMMALWMSQQGMFSYDGTSILPVKCMVKPWVDSDIDLVNVRQEACAVHLGEFNEFWWFFPQRDKPTNTRCIFYNYKEGWWSQGTMPRSAGMTSAYTAHPIMADGTIAIQHERIDEDQIYVNADLPWAETFDMGLNAGGTLTTVKQMIPDIDIVGGVDSDYARIGYSLYYRISRTRGTAEQMTPIIRLRDDGYVDFRTTGRDIRLRFAVLATPVPKLTLGAHLIDAVMRGDR